LKELILGLTLNAFQLLIDLFMWKKSLFKQVQGPTG